jgi:hypothetical protein
LPFTSTSSSVFSSRSARDGHVDAAAGETQTAPDVVPVWPSTVTVTVWPTLGAAGVEPIDVTLLALAPIVCSTAENAKSHEASACAPVRSGRRSCTVTVWPCAELVSAVAFTWKNTVAEPEPGRDEICCSPAAASASVTDPPVKPPTVTQRSLRAPPELSIS